MTEGRGIGASYHDLVQEVLDELRLEWARREEAVEVSAEEFGDEVAADVGLDVATEPKGRGRGAEAARGPMTYMSSKGEMKMSLSEMTWATLIFRDPTHTRPLYRQNRNAWADQHSRA